MREIKFRAWVHDIDGMVYPEVLVLKNGKPLCLKVEANNVLITEERLKDSTKVSISQKPSKLVEADWELMQFTGLSDKNGKEIYEGDILEWEGVLDMEHNPKRTLVEWSDETFFDGQDIDYCQGYVFEEDPTRAVVVGNKFENPELLKVKP
jgi:uncharacterized phage protein (TIGR01671 family)